MLFLRVCALTRTFTQQTLSSVTPSPHRLHQFPSRTSRRSSVLSTLSSKKQILNKTRTKNGQQKHGNLRSTAWTGMLLLNTNAECSKLCWCLLSFSELAKPPGHGWNGDAEAGKIVSLQQIQIIHRINILRKCHTRVNWPYDDTHTQHSERARARAHAGGVHWSFVGLT